MESSTLVLPENSYNFINPTSITERLAFNSPTLAKIFNPVVEKKAVLKTLTNVDIHISRPFQSVFDLKAQFCRSSVFVPQDIRIVRGGKELTNDMPLLPVDLTTQPTFIMTKPSSKTSARLSIVSRSESVSKTLLIPLNIKVFQLKKQIFSKKITELRPEMQRIIVDGKILRDENYIGDYLLKAALKRTSASDESLVTLYISKTLNPKHEVDISITLLNKKTLTFSFEITQPIAQFSYVLNRLYGIPLPSAETEYVFLMQPLKGEESAGKKSEALTKSYVIPPRLHGKSKDMIELDQTKTLVDYGVSESVKTLTVEMLRKKNITPHDEFVGLFELFFKMCLMTAEKRVADPNAAGNEVVLALPMKIQLPVPAGISSGSGLPVIEAAPAASVIQAKSGDEVASLLQKLLSGELPEKKQKLAVNATPAKSVGTASKGKGLFGSIKKGFLTETPKKAAKPKDAAASNQVSPPN